MIKSWDSGLNDLTLNENDLLVLDEILDSSLLLRSSLSPSQWYESKMLMPPNDTYPGLFRYDRTPYWREPTDLIDPNDPTTDITIMGPAQMGKSVGVLNAIIAWVIAQSPVNILFLTGHSDLSKEAMDKIDYVIKCCDLSHFITSNVKKARNNKTGDTASKKEFRGCDLKSGSITNHNLLRQNTARITLSDDLDAGKLGKDETGSTIALIGGRIKASENMGAKKYWVSTPQVKGRSLIEIQLEKSDKRKWFVECPTCGTTEKRIDLRMPFQVDDKNMAGLTWKLDNMGRVDPKTVGYICQTCAAWFDDRNKHELLNSGIWIPTKEPKELYHKGYQINGLYAPTGMTSWYNLANRYVACMPEGQPRLEKEWQGFINIDVGELYEETIDTISAMDIMKKARGFPIGVIPESVSESDGNGDIIFLSLSADCNGKLDDARIDWVLLAWSRSGPIYPVKYGSIGTFIPNQNALDKERERREHWTYNMGRENSVWSEFHKLRTMEWSTDTDRKMKVNMTGIDCKYLSPQVFNYIDRYPQGIIGLMGEKEKEYVFYDESDPVTYKSASRNNLFMVNVNMIKDNLANIFQLKWIKGESQPHQYINFPKFDFDTFFSHLESEEKAINDKGKFLWKKKTPTAQNHFLDCVVYAYATMAAFLWMGFIKINKEGRGTWPQFAAMVPVRKKGPVLGPEREKQ